MLSLTNLNNIKHVMNLSNVANFKTSTQKTEILKASIQNTSKPFTARSDKRVWRRESRSLRYAIKLFSVTSSLAPNSYIHK